MSWGDPWHLGDVDLSKLEGLDSQRAERVKAYLVGGEERYQEEQRKQTQESEEINLAREMQKELALQKKRIAEAMAENRPPLVLPDREETQEKLEEAAEMNRMLSNAIDELNAISSRALSTAIQAIHDIEGDDSYESDDLIMTIAYLAALQDPQD